MGPMDSMGLWAHGLHDLFEPHGSERGPFRAFCRKFNCNLAMDAIAFSETILHASHYICFNKRHSKPNKRLMYLCTYAAPLSPVISLPVAEIYSFACMPICSAILHLVLPLLWDDCLFG
jgi:hypothetical protein